MGPSNCILRADNLQKYFPVRSLYLTRRIGWLKAVDGVDLAIDKGETFGIVGESGCGKSTLGKTILGIYQPTGGQVWYEHQRIDNMPRRELRHLRKRMQYVYQDPGASLDPWWSIGRSLAEPLRVHDRVSTAERKTRIGSIVREVGLEENHIYRYPHEFSGGQQRRVGLARILIMRPHLIVFDEPTSGLDVSVQATILALFQEMKAAYGLTYIFISHDLDVIRAMTDRLAVMYFGQIVETGRTARVFQSPKHPYTQLLLAALPRIEREPWRGRVDMLRSAVPQDAQHIPSGCRFRVRCPLATRECEDRAPEMKSISPGWTVACYAVQRLEEERS